MRHMGKALLRWGYTLLLYLLAAVPLFWLMDSGLAAAGVSPPDYTIASWMQNMRGLFINTLAGSLALTTLWNLLYSWKLLGGHNPKGSINVMNLLFLLLHLGMSVGMLYVFTANPGVQNFLLGSELSYLALHFLPVLFIIPFFFATRLLGPESAAYRFRILNRLRPKLGLRYY